jgi:hypothetical protein
MMPSSQGGARDPQVLFDNLVVVGQLPSTEVILVDDVRTKTRCGAGRGSFVLKLDDGAKNGRIN